MCPVNVDMATYKSEFLNAHYAGRIRPRAHYLMGWLPLLSHIAHKLPVVPRLVNWVMHVPGISTLLARTGGLDTGRPLISFAPESLQKWASKREAHPGKERIVLWPDSFNSKLNTAPAQAAVEALEMLGYEVIVPQEFVCCGLTWHSTGQLSMTRRVLEHSAKVFAPYIEESLTVVALEPSCTVMLQHDATTQSTDPLVKQLSQATRSFAQVVAPKIAALVEKASSPPKLGAR